MEDKVVSLDGQSSDTPYCDRRGIYKEGGETRYYTRDKVFVLRMTDDPKGRPVPVWVHEFSR